MRARPSPAPVLTRAVLWLSRRRGWSGPVVLEPHLQNSPAVVATVENGRGLKENQTLKDLSQAAVYQVAAEAAKNCMAQAGAAWR